MRKTTVNIEEINKRNHSYKMRLIRRNWAIYLIFLPILLWFVVFRYVPLFGIVIAFKDYSVLSGVFDSKWVGFMNFSQVFASDVFLRAFRNTLLISFGNLLFGFPAPIIFALMLNELKFMKLKKVVQTVSYLPHFISWSVVGGIAYILLSPTSGVVNNMIRSLHGEGINFLGSSDWFRPMIITFGVWKSFGWGSIIYLAALSGVDEELYEAAYIDGATRMQRIIHITLPGISNIIVIMFILAIGRILNNDFEQIFAFINDMVLDVGETLEYYIYRVGLYDVNNFSIGTAVGFMKSIIGFVLIITTNILSKEFGEGYGIW